MLFLLLLSWRKPASFDPGGRSDVSPRLDGEEAQMGSLDGCVGEALLVPLRIEAYAMDSRASSAGDDLVGSPEWRSTCSEAVGHPSLRSVWETLRVNALRFVKRDGRHSFLPGGTVSVLKAAVFFATTRLE